ncbi:MAG: O-antigen ligase family protein [Clostridiales bacterium]|nr:O-antigen ligase family protein [Clostridiales bacterium]
MWQVFRPVENRSIIDIGVKIVMLGSLLTYVILKSYYNKINLNAMLLLSLYAFTQMISLRNNYDIFNFSYFVDLIFTVSMVFCFMILNSDHIINKEEMILFSKIIVAIVFVLCIFADVFQFDKIINALRTTTGYANAVSSVIASNHEFGLYLSFGIISCVFLLSKSNGSKKNNIIYNLLIALFFFNLILTFSRTSLLSVLIALFISIMMMRRYRLAFIGAVIIIVLIIILNPDLRDYFYHIVLRVDHDGNRGNLLKGGFTYFAEASILEKIFGVGQSRTILYAREISISSNFHNGYITILLNGGLTMIIFFIIIVFDNIYNAIKTMKYDKYDGAYLLAASIVMLLYMWGQTPLIFSSDLVSSMLTFYCIVIPKYYYNYHKMAANLSDSG